jgi:uncharacterized protein
METNDKLLILKKNIASMKSVAVAFSGGVDSTLLLKVAHDVLRENAIAVTVRSSIHAERETQQAVEIAQRIGVRQTMIDFAALDMEGFADNPVNRCYLCKKAIFSMLKDWARQNLIRHVADGANRDDLDDYRPGTQAARELGIISPLMDAGMTKYDIRILSRQMGLPTWDKPALACLATRIPYGRKITLQELQQVDRGEQVLMDLGFSQARVRHHGDTARIEVSSEERDRFFSKVLMDEVYEKFREIGFVYVSLDLKGYRTGSMNETIPADSA